MLADVKWLGDDSCQKRYPLTVPHDCVAGSGIQLIEVTHFLELFADQVRVFN